ncbi:hypothetical protein AB3X52_12070 [Nocardioides sp. DS6]|uniref:Extradiol ring-cleavage dioxygenase LigAB LigA subunit domain-containing protein n=1 Tax=Nocardioides eburneus TaxID=3231482 RepID=A0ABV3T2A2_9ACTN
MSSTPDSPRDREPAGDAHRRPLDPPADDLDEPGTIAFTARRALDGQRLNRFALSLRSAPNRSAFLADESAYLKLFAVPAEQRDLVARRDWTGLLLAGGHLQAVLKLSATLGGTLLDIGAHNVGCDRDALASACPRMVDGLPAGMP